MKYTIVCDGEKKKEEQEVELQLRKKNGWVDIEARFKGTDGWEHMFSLGHGTHNYTCTYDAALIKYGFKKFNEAKGY